MVKIKDVEIKGYTALAPMAGVADRAFRDLCTSFGASYTVSEMVSSKGISYNSKKSAELMESSDTGNPCGVQIFGDDPKTMANAAEFAMSYNPQIIDINMGCPAPKISGNGSGSALMRNPSLCGEIVKAVSSAVDVPVTVKIRKGWDDDLVNAVEVAKICEANGAAAIAVHGRTRKQYYAPPVDYDIIAEVKKAVSVPVIANGDITSGKKAKEVLEKTNCDMVMIGRGALGNPWIFCEIESYLKDGTVVKPPSAEEKIKIMKKHIEKICEFKTEKFGMREARKHVAWYLKGFRGAASFRNEAGRLSTLSELDDLCDRVLKAQKV